MKKLIVFIFSIVLLGSCQKDIEGCTDATAINYNPDATIDNSSCQYVPVLSTVPATISGTTVETGGVISSDGGSAITLRGVCWATTQNPTIAYDTTINGSGTGSFSSVINNLEVTTYYLRAYATNSKGTGYGDELSFTVEPEIGYTFQGGIVFYLDGNGGGLIAAPTDQSSEYPWGCYGTTMSGADGSAIGTGAQNTIDIEAGCTTPGTAADICANLTLGGYSDWFLPSKSELSLMYLYIGQGNSLGLGNIGGFNVYGYWSSTQDGNDYAWGFDFGNGLQGVFFKNLSATVRAVRAF